MSARSNRDPLLGTFATSRKTPYNAIYDLKKNRSYQQAKSVIQKIGFYNLNDALFGEKQVRKWEDISSNKGLPKSTDWIEEIGWLAHGIKASAPILKSFIVKRREFGRAFILGEFLEAERILHYILENFGISLWLAERELMLLQEKDGFDAHKKRLSALQESLIGSPVVSYIITVISNRLEPHATPESFIASMTEALQGLRGSGHASLAAQVECQVMPWSFEWESHKQDIANHYSRRPVIDRYNAFVKLVSCLDLNGLSMADQRRVKLICQDVYSDISDPQLKNVLACFSPTSDTHELSRRDHEYASVLEMYLKGQFAEATSASERLIAEDPTSFDAYWLHARAAACCDREIKSKLNEKCVARRIVTALQAIAENKVDLNVFYGELKAVALRLGDNHLGISLAQIAEREFTGNMNSTACHYAAIMSRVISPEPVMASLGYIKTRIDCLNSVIYNQTVNAFFRLELTGMDNILDEAFLALAQAKAATQQKNYNAVIQYTPTITSGKTRKAICLALEALPLEFDALLALNKPVDAVAALVRSYNLNKNSLRHVRFESLVRGTKENEWPELAKSPYAPALIFLNNGDEQDLYEAVDDYMIANEVPSLDHLLNIIDGFPADLAKIILRDVLIPPVLSRGALWAETPEDQRGIRTKILQKLYSISTEDQALVVSELSGIEKARMLENAYRKVEGPKFFLDYPELNRYYSEILEGVFARYLLFRDYEKHGGKLITDSRLLALATGEAEPQLDKKEETSEILLSNVATLVFTDYLWNPDRGLNATLGTRIRHGAVENQLKRIFEAQDILAIKNLSGNYECPKRTQYIISGLPEPTRKSIENAYYKLTDKVSEIYLSLVNKILRIRVPITTISAFNEAYGLSTKEGSVDTGILDFSPLFDGAQQSKLNGMDFANVASLIGELHKVFIERAHIALESARDHLAYDTTADLERALSELDSTIASTLDDGNTRALLRENILIAKNNFTNDIRIIQNWFSLASTIETGLGSMRDLIQSAARVVDFASNGKLGKAGDYSPENVEVSAGASVAIYEVLVILFRNIVQHSRMLNGQAVECSFVRDEEGKSILTVSNVVTSPEVLRDSVEHATRKLTQPRDPRVLEKSPGGTGLARAKALLAQISTSAVGASATGSASNKISIQFTYKL